MRQISAAVARNTKRIFINPQIAQHRADIGACFPIRDRFNPQQRVATILDLDIPALDRGRSCIIGGDHFGQRAAGGATVAEVLDIGLAQRQICRGIGEVAAHLRQAHHPRRPRHQLHQADRSGRADDILPELGFL